ncbi:transcription initiation factor TFIID subunit 11 [Stygiomarasmius scandens]|uniref:Transcription initiation factor TFIID subunit 11 n=1 Tax=Marasmiellus scandens TaxID=2682957 RepID=A0ABR1JZ21_9AGAR
MSNIPNAPYSFSASPSPVPAERTISVSTPTPAPRPYTGAKRGRKPRGAAPAASPRIDTPTSQYQHVHWSLPDSSGNASSPTAIQGPSIAAPKSTTPSLTSGVSAYGQYQPSTSTAGTGTSGTPTTISAATLASLNLTPANLSILSSLGITPSSAGLGSGTFGTTASRPGAGAEDDGEGDDEMLPAMADDDYSAHSTWNSQSKDNMKVLMDNLSPDQYERFEAYRRHALPKQAVRKVIQQTLGQQVSQPVAQIVAGFSKVFVGEIIEKARKVQARRGETGPLSPDHLREAYRMYQEETGRVGAARPGKGKRLFVR